MVKKKTLIKVYDTLTREIKEEVGKTPQIKKFIPLEYYTSADKNFDYSTYVLVIEKEFIPQLNDEHTAYAWCSYGNYPQPLHRAVKNILNNKLMKSKLELIIELVH